MVAMGEQTVEDALKLSFTRANEQVRGGDDGCGGGCFGGGGGGWGGGGGVGGGVWGWCWCRWQCWWCLVVVAGGTDGL